MTTVYGDLVRYRELFGNLFRRDVQAKYRGSLLGVAWTLANPVLLMGVYLLVFSVLWKTPFAIGRPLRAVPARRAVGLDLLRHLRAVGVRSMLDNANLIRKTRFPRQLLPLSVVATHLISFGVMLVVAARGELRAAAARAGDRVACAATRRGDRRVHVRARARDRVAERVVPRPRVPGVGAVAAALLPDAGPLSAQRSADRPAATGSSTSSTGGIRSRRRSRRCGIRCFTAGCPGSGDTIYPSSPLSSPLRSARTCSAASTTRSQSKSDAGVVDPGLVAFGQPRGQARRPPCSARAEGAARAG